MKLPVKTCVSTSEYVMNCNVKRARAYVPVYLSINKYSRVPPPPPSGFI